MNGKMQNEAPTLFYYSDNGKMIRKVNAVTVIITGPEFWAVQNVIDA
jgi:hypothetical protein